MQVKSFGFSSLDYFNGFFVSHLGANFYLPKVLYNNKIIIIEDKFKIVDLHQILVTTSNKHGRKTSLNKIDNILILTKQWVSPTTIKYYEESKIFFLHNLESNWLKKISNYAALLQKRTSVESYMYFYVKFFYIYNLFGKKFAILEDNVLYFPLNFLYLHTEEEDRNNFKFILGKIIKLLILGRKNFYFTYAGGYSNLYIHKQLYNSIQIWNSYIPEAIYGFLDFLFTIPKSLLKNMNLKSKNIIKLLKMLSKTSLKYTLDVLKGSLTLLKYTKIFDLMIIIENSFLLTQIVLEKLISIQYILL